KDRVLEMKKWARFVKRARDEQRDRLNLAIVAANNHYAGFGPGTANTFRKMLDLSEVTWNGVVIPNTGENAPRIALAPQYYLIERAGRLVDSPV
ncbi:MAG: hypothetical protein WA421_01435, partial [Nitrososphaeraceae archaeon]